MRRWVAVKRLATGETLLRARWCASLLCRFRGLMLHPRLAPGEALLLVERRDSRGRWYWDCDYDDDDYNYGRKNRKGGGPKFCQNGQGHPVHGMAWCRAKGWDNRYSLRNVGWGDVILRRPRYDTRGDLGRSILEGILGRRVYGRFDDQRLRLGERAPLVGYWTETRSGSVLDLFAGGVQVGQLIDRDRDGRAVPDAPRGHRLDRANGLRRFF